MNFNVSSSPYGGGFLEGLQQADQNAQTVAQNLKTQNEDASQQKAQTLNDEQTALMMAVSQVNQNGGQLNDMQMSIDEISQYRQAQEEVEGNGDAAQSQDNADMQTLEDEAAVQTQNQQESQTQTLEIANIMDEMSTQDLVEFATQNDLGSGEGTRQLWQEVANKMQEEALQPQNSQEGYNAYGQPDLYSQQKQFLDLFM